MSGELSLDTVAANQSGKEVTVNQIFGEVESAIAGNLVVNLSTASANVTTAQLQRCSVIVCSSATAARTLTLAAVKRLIAIVCDATCTAAVTVTVGTATSVLGPGKAGLFALDGTTNGLAAIGGSAGSPAALAGLSDVAIVGTPTTGYVLRWNGTAWAPAASSGGGSGGASPSLDYAPPNAVDWTAGAHITLADYANRGMSLLCPYNTVGGGTIVVKAAPTAASFTVSAKMYATGGYGTYPTFGMFVGVAASGKSVGIFAQGANGNRALVVQRCQTDLETYVSNQFGANTSDLARWMRVRLASSALFFETSEDKIAWATVYSEAVSAYLAATPDRVGFRCTGGSSSGLVGGNVGLLIENYSEA